MKYAFILLWGLFSMACNKSDGDNQAFIKTEAILANKLAVDGCSWHFSIDTEGITLQAAATEKSHDLVIEPFIETLQNQNGLFDNKVEILYRPTNNKRDVTCGWNTVTKMDEIEVKQIKKI